MLAVLDYDAGNIESVRLALLHVGGRPHIVADAATACTADRLVFPGVGSAGQCMAKLKARGFDAVLADALRAGKPVLAICIGMQLVFDRSEEDGGVAALGFLPGSARLLRPTPERLGDKVPHMGWNRVEYLRPHPLLPEGTAGGDYYFVHSYYAEPAWREPQVAHADLEPGRLPGIVYGRTEHAGCAFTAMAGRRSLFAAQFHPEKSGEVGLDMLGRFLRWDGRT